MVSNATVCFKQPILHTAECSIHFSFHVEFGATLGKRCKICVWSLQEKWVSITSCDRAGQSCFWRRISGSVYRTSSNRTGRHRSPDVLNQSRSSAFYHWPKALPLSTKWARLFSSHLPLHAITSIAPTFREPIPLKAQLPNSDNRAFLPHNRAVVITHMTSEIRFLFRSSYRGCLPTSPSTYPALRPASHLSPGLGCTCGSRSAAGSMRLPWNYATDPL